MNQQHVQQLVTELYQAVDPKNVDYLGDKLAEKTRFRIGNYPAETNKSTILDANRDFFSSIDSMRHTIEDVFSQTIFKDGKSVDKITCFGRVDYVCLNSTEHSVVFSTFLEKSYFNVPKLSVYLVRTCSTSPRK